MKARVKQNHRWPSVVAFSGIEYVKGEWRDVSPQNEQEALIHPYLEIKGKDIPQEQPVEEQKPSADALLQQMIDKEPIEVKPKSEKKSVKK